MKIQELIKKGKSLSFYWKNLFYEGYMGDTSIDEIELVCDMTQALESQAKLLDEAREVMKPFAEIHERNVKLKIGPAMPRSVWKLCDEAAAFLKKLNKEIT